VAADARLLTTVAWSTISPSVNAPGGNNTSAKLASEAVYVLREPHRLDAARREVDTRERRREVTRRREGSAYVFTESKRHVKSIPDFFGGIPASKNCVLSVCTTCKITCEN